MSDAAVHSIDHFALFVPYLEQGAHFFGHFGLDVQPHPGAGGGLDLRAGDGHRWGRLLPADRKSLAWLSFNCFEADLSALMRQAQAAGAEPCAAPPQAEAAPGPGFWCRDPDGNLLQVRVGPKTMPDQRSAQFVRPAAADRRGAWPRSAQAQVRPRRMSHVLLFAPDVLRTAAFYEQALGLRLSDRSADVIAFTHAPHGCDHHLVAFAKSSAKGWHHVSWEVADINEVGAGASQMAAVGYQHGWGTGRHVLGSNYFHYVQDPWGSFSEFSAEMDYVSAGSEWPAGNHLPEDSLYLWGPDVPPDFIFNTEA